MMREIIVISLLLAFVMALQSCGFQLFVSSPQAEVLTSPYLQNVKQDGITIMWELSGIEDSWVEYGTDKSYGHTISGVPAESNVGTFIYKAILTGLDVGSTYRYRVIKGRETLAEHSFTTAPDGNANFSFGVWGDSQGTNKGAYPEDPNEPTTSMMANMAENVDFAVTVGDLCEANKGQDPNFVKMHYLDRVVKHLAQKKPLFIAWGNHDGGRNALIRQFADLPSKDRGAPYHAGFGNYSFDYAGCHFVCVDDDPLRKPDTQRWDWEWMEKDLKQARANNPRFIFFFIHRGPYCERWFAGETPMRENLVPLLEKYKVDVCFSGHIHGYGRGYKNGVYYCVTGGGSWLDSHEPLVHDWPHMTVGGYHNLAPGIDGGLVNEYVKVEVNESGFVATMIAFNPDGTVMDGVVDTFSKSDLSADNVSDE